MGLEGDGASITADPARLAPTGSQVNVPSGWRRRRHRHRHPHARTPAPHGFGTGVNWGRIILHELAHVIGLGHVESKTSIMNEALTQQTLSSSEWGVGDLIGLRQLGREGGCVTVPTFPRQGAPR